MRSAYNHNILTDNGTFVGIDLGADFTSEHEWGIKDLRNMFGMNDKKDGIDRRTATIVPEDSIRFAKGKNFSVLICCRMFADPIYGWTKYIESDEFKKDLTKGSIKNCELTIYKSYRKDADPQTLATAWDSKSFGIMVANEHSDKLEELYEAIKAKDVAIWLGGGGVFQNSGLVVAIRSRCPEEGLKNMLDADLDAKKLKKADEKTGIKEKLRSAGKEYFACSPAWAKDTGDYDTKHDVVYLLNPMEQRDNNFGWFTVEDLEEWCEGKGKIPMTEEQKAKA